MKLTLIHIESFKALSDIKLHLAKINVLVGSNNSGKSCALQAIHFAVSLAQTATEQNTANFSPERLRYCPTEMFLDLKHKETLSEGAKVSVLFETMHEDGTSIQQNIHLTRGRNSTVSTTAPRLYLKSELGKSIANLKSPFSIYVPGLAGIPSKETYHGKLVVDRGAVRGDSNLYLRNVLYRLYKDEAKKQIFLKRLASIFPGLTIDASNFEEHKHETIPVTFTRNKIRRPLDMVGTGTLQAIQILSYATYYEPKLLLLDEPDAHLHADNQRKLVDVLNLLTEDGSMQVILATHSRHLIHELAHQDHAKIFRLKDGELIDTEFDFIDLLMDLGAIDKFESLTLVGKHLLVLGEDAKLVTDQNHYLRLLLQANGVQLDSCLFVGYEGCTEARAAILLAQFVAEHHPDVKVLIHRDRDFLLDDEIDSLLKSKYEFIGNTKLFITEGSDLESYFVTPEYVAAICNGTIDDAKTWIDSVAKTKNNALVTRFNDKRAALHKQFGSKKGCLKKTEDIRSPDVPLPVSQRTGKDMLDYLKEQAKVDVAFNGLLNIPVSHATLESEYLRQLCHGA